LAKPKPLRFPSEFSERLGRAIAGQDVDTVRALIAQGADVNYREDPAEETLLMAAARTGNLEVVRALVEAGADVDDQIDDVDDLGETASALVYAARQGHRAVHDYLAPRCRPDVRKDAEAALAVVRARATKLKLTKEERALLQAASKGQVAKVRALLDAGLDVNLADEGGGTLLWVAAACGKAGVVRLLLDRGADVDARHLDDGTTPLLASDSLEVVRMLLAAGADRRATGRYGECLPLNAASFDWTELLGDLIGSGFDVDTRDRTGQTALHRAAGYGRAEVVRLLLAAGAGRDVRDVFGQTPRDLAAACGHDAVVALLGGRERP
jgi:ankyrin repeat protein